MSLRSSNHISEEILKSALIEASNSTMRSQHGAISFTGNTIIGKGHNYMLPLKNGGEWSEHAERESIKNALKKNNSNNCLPFDLVVVRKHKDNDRLFRNSKPCKKCTEFINKYINMGFLRFVFYSTDNTTFSCIK